MNPNQDHDTAIHEAGHAIAAGHFKIPALPEILDEGRSVATQTTFPDSAGLCSYDEGRIPPLQFAVICWAGQLAQCLFAEPPPWAPAYKPSALLLKDWFGAMMVQIKEFSPTDRQGILACYKQAWRACSTSFRIIKKNKRRIVRLAKVLTAGRQPAPAVAAPMPGQFPAGLDMFLKLVVTGDDAETKFREFITAQTELFFTAAQIVFATPEERQAAMDKWTTARLEHWRTFRSADEWQGQARAFRAWTQPTPATS